MSALETLEKLHADLIRQRRDVDADMKRLEDAYKAKMVEYRQISHGIIGIENEIRELKERNE